MPGRCTWLGEGQQHPSRLTSEWAGAAALELALWSGAPAVPDPGADPGTHPGGGVPGGEDGPTPQDGTDDPAVPVKVANRKAHLKGTKVSLRAQCLAAAGCTGRAALQASRPGDLSAKARNAKYAKGSFSLAPNSRGKVKLKLTKQGKRHFRAKAKAKAKVWAVLRPDTGTATTRRVMVAS